MSARAPTPTDAASSSRAAPASATSAAATGEATTWRVVLSYDGGRFCGWERQKNGLAVQEVVEDALYRLTQERVEVHGSGRTDAGVHAEGQVVSFRVARPMLPRKLRLGLNALLPPDVAALSCERAAPDFHARFSARRKTYRYRILNGPARRPLLRGQAYHFPQTLDVARMDAAAKTLVGTHDFRAFAKESARKKNCVRTVFAASATAETLDAETRLVAVELTGSGFLYNMVRIVTGTLAEIGLGRRPVDAFGPLLAGVRRADAGFTVPPHGLCLVSVDYDAPRP